MLKQVLSGLGDTIKEFGCAIAIFDKNGKIIYLNGEALGILGRNIMNLELLPGRYVENEDFWENLKKYRTLFTHKALLKAGTETYKIRGMMHLLAEQSEENPRPDIYALAFEVRDERIFGSVTLERIIEHSGFVAIHWVVDDLENDVWHARYVSSSISKFGYKREEFYENHQLCKQLICEDDWDTLREESLDNIKRGKLEYTRQYRIKTKDGRLIPVHDYIHMVLNENGQLQSVELVIFDLVMETERNANLLLLENVVNRSNNIVIVWNCEDEYAHSEVRYVSNNIDRIGISPSKLRNGILRYQDLIHPDDLKRVEDVFCQQAKKGYQYLSLEYRLMSSTGQEIWIQDESTLVELPGGERFLESILTDISENKRREQQLVAQREDLERKIRYIESEETMLSDMSVIDFISKEELQDLQSAFAKMSRTYNAIIDLDGEPITFPDGPDTNMGAFYDMFERTEYKKGYFELNKKLRKEKGPVVMALKEFSNVEIEKKRAKSGGALPEHASLAQLVKATSSESKESTAGVILGLPLFIDNKHMATWISCAFTREEIDSIEDYKVALWSLCKYIAKYIYSNTISQKQTQKAKLSELQARELLERSQTIRDILRRCNELNDEKALTYVLRKMGDYLKVSRISLFRYNQDNQDATCWYEWDAPGLEKNIDFKLGEVIKGRFDQQNAFVNDGQVVLNGDQIPIRLRRLLWEHHIRAMVALPIYTLTAEQQYIMFAESAKERVWTEEELSFMQSAVSILQGFLQRMRSNVNVQDVKNNQLEFFSLSREYIYIKSQLDDEILYINPRLAEVVGENKVGKRCYEVFRKQFIHCIDCFDHEGGCTELKNCRVYQHMFKRPMRIRQMEFTWEGNVPAKVIIMSPENE